MSVSRLPKAKRFLPSLGMATVILLWVLRYTHCAWLGDYLKAYHPAGQFILSDPRLLYFNSSEVTFVNVPILALPFTGLFRLGEAGGGYVFSILGLGAVLASFVGWVKYLGVGSLQAWIILYLFVINGPLSYSVREGNTTHFLLLLMVAFFVFWRRDWFILAGASLGIAALIKVPLLLFGAFFFFRSYWRALFGFLVTVISVLALSVFIYGLPLHELWFERCIRPFQGSTLAALNVQSVPAFFARLMGANAFDWDPVSLTQPYALFASVLRGLILLAAAVVMFRSGPPRDKQQLHRECFMVLTLSLLISPISWTHYHLFLILPLSLYAVGQMPLPPGRLWPGVMVAIGIAVSMPMRALHFDHPALQWFANISILSLCFWGALSLYCLMVYTHGLDRKAEDLTEQTVDVMESQTTR